MQFGRAESTYLVHRIVHKDGSGCMKMVQLSSHCLQSRATTVRDRLLWVNILHSGCMGTSPTTLEPADVEKHDLPKEVLGLDSSANVGEASAE